MEVIPMNFHFPKRITKINGCRLFDWNWYAQRIFLKQKGEKKDNLNGKKYAPLTNLHFNVIFIAQHRLVALDRLTLIEQNRWNRNFAYIATDALWSIWKNHHFRMFSEVRSVNSMRFIINTATRSRKHARFLESGIHPVKSDCLIEDNNNCKKKIYDLPFQKYFHSEFPYSTFTVSKAIPNRVKNLCPWPKSGEWVSRLVCGCGWDGWMCGCLRDHWIEHGHSISQIKGKYCSCIIRSR